MGEKEMAENSPSRIARSFYSFHELDRKLRVQKFFDMFDLEFSIPVWKNLDDQSRLVDKGYADSRVCVIGCLGGASGEKRKP